MPDAVRRQIHAVLFDIDDTITTDGRLPAASYAAIERLQQAGFITVPVTGRPAGWCDLIARFWPVAGVVGENGAFYFAYDREARQMTRHYWADAATRAANRAKLEAIVRDVAREVPAARIAADQAYREADLAIDICEDIEPLSEQECERVVTIFQRHGATVKVSSIHVNGWFGDYDKRGMAMKLLSDVTGQDEAGVLESTVYVGDSPNDEPMFAAFPWSVGVANIRDVADGLRHPPRWITRARGGTGFIELAEALLRSRS